MLILLSPAKKLLPFVTPYTGNTSLPALHSQADTLIDIMKTKSVADLASLMDLSTNLAQLNYDRYQHFYMNHSPLDVSYPAILLFQGDVYQGLKAHELSAHDLAYAQHHLAILSGLYGILKPLDLIQAYRLEMGTRLSNPKGATLYDFWREKVTDAVNTYLSQQKNPVLINLASSEYFKVIHVKKINYPIITINFYEQKNNQMKMVGIYAKKARGMMARYLIQQRVDEIELIKDFSESNYCFQSESSSGTQLNFIRAN